MFIPQLLVCLGAQCYIGSGESQPTMARCREHVEAVMVVQVRQLVPQAIIRAGRCLPAPEDPAA
jgi:hypothetical protein